MAYCPLCEKKFDTRKGLQGHFRFKHKFEITRNKPARETAFTEAIGRNIERRISGGEMMKAMEEEKEEERMREAVMKVKAMKEDKRKEEIRKGDKSHERNYIDKVVFE